MDWTELVAVPIFGALVGVAVWYFQSRIQAIDKAKENLNAERRKAYSDVLEPFIRVFAGIKNPAEQKKALKQIQSFEYKRAAFEFSLIGADGVIKSFNDLMVHIYSTEEENLPDPSGLLKLWGALLLEIRKNVGNPNTKLAPVDMLKSQIKGIDEILNSVT